MNLPTFQSGMLPVQSRRLAQTLRREGRPVLTFSLTLPHLTGDTRAERRIERYYAHLAECWRRHWTGLLFRRACAAETAARTAETGFAPWEGEVTYTVALQRRTLLSLIWEARERQDGREIRRRYGDTWDLSNGIPLSLHALSPGVRHWHTSLLEEVSQQIQAQSAAGASFYPLRPGLLRKAFCPECFALTPEGVSLWFPPGSIAPEAAGSPVFTVPCSLPGIEDTAPSAENS